MKRKISALLVFALLTLLLLIPVSGAVSLSFIAVNDTMSLTLSGEQRPFYSGGTLYVPYTVFNASSLGFYPSYSVSEKSLTLFSLDKRLVFDLSGGTVTDETKLTQAVATVTKGSTVFLPVSFCAGHFGVSVSDLSSRGGYQLIRFTTGNQVYDDWLFVEKAENWIVARVAHFLEPTTPEIPNQPVTPDEPDDTNEPVVAPVGIYLAITGTDALISELPLLSQNNLKATFFLTAEEIAANNDLVRRAAAEGHYIGLTISGTEDIPGQLLRANAALDQATQTQSLLALLPDAAQPADLTALYRIFVRPAIRLTATEAAKAAGQTRLMICDHQTLAESLRILKAAETEFLPLRETPLPN